MHSHDIVPLIIGGKDILPTDEPAETSLPHNFHGATPALADQAVESSAAAFPGWSRTSAPERRRLLMKLAELIRQRSPEIESLIRDEIHCCQPWAVVNTAGGTGIVEQAACLITEAIAGSIPYTDGDNSYGLVFKDPLGVGSEFSPRTHYLLASLFRDAGFPPGVVNFLLHHTRDAADVFDAMITHPAIQKCNFTGSTEVGRIIASKSAMALKPVLLELGGKNFALVLDDADLDLAADHIVHGAFLNNGQICMSTDLVLCTAKTSMELEDKILARLISSTDFYEVITEKGKEKLENLVADAAERGSMVHQNLPNGFSAQAAGTNHFPATFLSGITTDMDFYSTESFGPILGLMIARTEDMSGLVRGAGYGLSAAIFTKDYSKALNIAKSLPVGAVHVNGSTVHDEPTLPHGGRGMSGFGRFGARWGLDEFLQTRTVVLN
ncbi:aldehyde dehydrogenase [Aspergillus venezuelensis]